MFYYLYFIICVIEIINATTLKNEKEVLNTLSNSASNEVSINIDSEIDITNEITINNSIKKLHITGDSLDSSKLNLKFPLYFNSNIKELEIKNINVNGDLFFKNNEKITLNTVNLNGYIDSDFNENSDNYIEITKLNFKSTRKSVENCINLSGNIKISKSNFFGNSSCENRLLHYNGYEKYALDLKDSNFDGENECPFLSIEKALHANIESVLFENGYSSRYIDGGTGMTATSSNININNCTFNDILSYNNGGAFSLIDNIQVNGSNLNFNNVTSLGSGSIFHISSFDPSVLTFRNITQKNTGNIRFMREGGLIMNVEGQAEVDLNTYYGENLINYELSGSAFVASENVKLNVSNVYIKNLIGNGAHDGLFYTSHDVENIEFNADNITLYDLYQSSPHESSILNFERGDSPIMNNIKIYNSGGYNTCFINMDSNGIISLSNFEVDYFESKTSREFINSEINIISPNRGYSTISNCKVSNLISRGVLFRNKSGKFDISNCEFRKIHECYKYNNCTSMSPEKKHVTNAELMVGYGNTNATCDFKNTTFDQIYGEAGILILTATASFNYCNVTNSYFKTGLLHWDDREKERGAYEVNYSIFENNTSEIGTIINFPYISSGTVDKVEPIPFNFNTFNNNKASKYGGVMYTGINADRMVFTNCTFNNNQAESGNIIYAYSKEILPHIDTELNLTDISTNPAYFKMDGNETDIENISILSSESIPEGIKFKLYDGYGNQMFFPHKTNSSRFEDLVIFIVETEDSFKAQVLGQSLNYCWNEVCELPGVKVIGNPGIHTLSLKFISTGVYPIFLQDSIDIRINILECNETLYLNQPIGKTHLKSCYKPKCEFECNQNGECINNDFCNCKPNFKGKYCDEHVKLERNETADTIFIIIAIIIIIIIIILIGMTIHYRNVPLIKGGGVEFLILILIGLIFNIANAIFLTFEKKIFICYYTYILSNTGFSFVFGSIFVKSYRIYRIFCRHIKSMRAGLNKKIMFLIIALITLFHWIMSFIWYMNKNVSIANAYTADEIQFVRCIYPQSKNISTLFNIVILMLEFALSYSIRKVEKRFKEVLVLPAYIYIFYMIFMIILNSQSEINVVMQDYFDIMVIFVATSVSIYDLFIIKYIELYTIKPERRISYMKAIAL